MEATLQITMTATQGEAQMNAHPARAVRASVATVTAISFSTRHSMIQYTTHA